ncbi:MAG: UDP-glucose/GDP-mannose dehydrogenase family protein [Candidatus Binatus sp.]|uniref:UDP-glucose dehydrogenase family protein n=1 Tax=Candidatus Binatus sp. TaxID=2811406 RepID=UPI0027259AEF|nr:UDP-glucose/GDP-mannose dehydrogenase family protein [Candidatus Binatus sp.]MDO8431040.1 UDP-glucose/GDP-mannose dehydrogenase family protein [Candidatus Binatus sp.]
MNITVVGTGYVGLVSGTCYAESGNEVVCVDIDERRIAQLIEGKAPFYEPGLEELVRRNVKEGRLHFTTDVSYAVAQSMVSYIAVGTPMNATGAADLSAIFKAAEDIARAVTGYHIIAIKSTVPVGTNDRVREIVNRVAKHRIDVCSVPEFLKEGSAIEDFMRPDRVVIGSLSDQARAILREIHSPFVRTDNPILEMDPKSAELTKYASNAMLALRISFINDMANLCDAVGADINAVRRGLGSDRRIGSSFLFPGIGYGGSCFPKDVQALIHSASENGLDFALLAAAESVNMRQKRLIPQRVKQHFGDDLSGKVFAVWGTAFKPRTDDMREAPSLVVIEELLRAGAQCRVHDPEALENARKYFGDRVTYHKTNYEALKNADALLILTEWNEFRRPNFQRIKNELKQPVIFDGRNLYDPDLMKALEFRYYSVGRHPV